MIHFEAPRLVATDQRGQMEEMRRYLYRLTEQLNLALSTVDEDAEIIRTIRNTSSLDGTLNEQQSINTFNSVKALIIKSADIITAYMEKFQQEFNGLYVAQSDFGTFQEVTRAQIEQNSQGMTSLYDNIQTIISQIEGFESAIIEVNAYIRQGLLYYNDDGVPIYGLEIGQKTKQNDEEVFNKFARFTSDRLSFFDQNGTEVAYISDLKLHIRQAKVTEIFEIGGFQKKVNANREVITRWVGGTV